MTGLNQDRNKQHDNIIVNACEPYTIRDSRQDAMQTMNILGLNSMIILAVMLLLLNASACFAKTHEESTPSAKEVQKQTTETYKTIKIYTIDQRDEALATMNKQLESVDAKIDQMSQEVADRWQSMSKATREKSREMMRKLNNARQDVAEWYGGMQHSSTESWEEVKEGYADSYERLQQAFDSAQNDLRKDQK